MTADTIRTREVDTVDIAPFFAGGIEQRRAVAEQVDIACKTLGFLVIKGHGVSQQLIGEMHAAAAHFFSLPAEVKMQYRSASGAPGYQPPQATALGRTRGGTAPPDLKEGFRMLPPRRPPSYTDADAAVWFQDNIWPQEVPEYSTTALAYFHAMEELAGTLLRIMAMALGLPDDFFQPTIDADISRLSALHYPATGADVQPDQMGAGAHTDYGSLTVLHKEPGAQGLQVQHPDGTWLDVVAQPGSFIVNIGDLLAEWTNDRWVSTVHRIVNTPNAGATISLAFFHQPNHNAMIEPIPTCVDADHPARYLPITSGEHLRKKLNLQEG